jgi:predicted ArsR family transcriptional regulator
VDLPPSAEDPLTQPTRARLFELLVEARQAVRTAELASRLGLHPNGVRRNLERLQEAGLVERSQVKGARGRPGDRWTVAVGAEPAGEAPTAYLELARWLTRATPAGPGRLREVERSGREIGRELSPTHGGDPIERFRQALAALGFQPSPGVKTESGLACRLENCPYRDSVRENPDLICTLHRGITAGLLAEIDGQATLRRFEPRDPDRAGCLVEVSWGESRSLEPSQMKRVEAL